MNTLKSMRKGMKTGDRLPKFVVDLVSLMDMPQPGKVVKEEPHSDSGPDGEEDVQSQQQIAARGSSTDQGKWAQMQALRRVDPKRKLLKRLSSGESPPPPPLRKTPSGQPPSAPPASGSKKPMFWVFGQVCFRQRGTCRDQTETWEESGGFKNFVFADGEAHLSEEPALLEDLPIPSVARKGKSKVLKHRR